VRFQHDFAAALCVVAVLAGNEDWEKAVVVLFYEILCQRVVAGAISESGKE
jgi:hypothetical protein